MTRADIVDRLHRALSGRTDVRLAVLFGSQARGSARTDSDVDLAVDGPNVDETRLAAELSDLLGCEVDIVSLGTESIPLLHAIVRDGIVVHEAHHGVGALWRSRSLATLETDLPWFRKMGDAALAPLAARAGRNATGARRDG